MTRGGTLPVSSRSIRPEVPTHLGDLVVEGAEGGVPEPRFAVVYGWRVVVDLFDVVEDVEDRLDILRGEGGEIVSDFPHASRGVGGRLTAPT